MDMGVTVDPVADKRDAQTDVRAARIRSNPNSSDLDEWLAKVEAMGELKRISAEVDPDLEAATITYLVGSQASPALPASPGRLTRSCPWTDSSAIADASALRRYW